MRHRPCHARHAWWIRRVGTYPTPNIELHGGQGRHPQIIGGFFYALFQFAARTNSCRQCAGADLPLGSCRLDHYTTVGQGRMPHTQGWCQDQGAFFTHYPVSSRHAASWFCAWCSMSIRLLLSIVWPLEQDAPEEMWEKLPWGK